MVVDLTTENLGGHPAVHPEQRARETKKISWHGLLVMLVLLVFCAGLLVTDTVLPLLLAPSFAHVSAGRVPPPEQTMQD